MSSYEVHLHPPAYPQKSRPSLCRHEPQFVMQHDARVVRTKGKNHVEIDHSVCLACGIARPCTIGGNILVDLVMLSERFGFHAQIGGRIADLRNKWSRIATYLFDENGWNGRHERVARLIDPLLTMKLFLEPINHPVAIAAGHKMGRITFDPSYVREPERYTSDQSGPDLGTAAPPAPDEPPAGPKPGTWTYALACRDLATDLRAFVTSISEQAAPPLHGYQRDILVDLLMREFEAIKQQKLDSFEEAGT